MFKAASGAVFRRIKAIDLSAGGGFTSFNAYLQTTLVPHGSVGSSTPTFTRASTAYVPGYGAAGVVTDPPTAQLLASGEAGFWGARRVSQGVWSLYDANGVLLVPANGASTGLCDQFGNFGYFSGGARADVLGTTNAIRRTMTDGGWVSGGGGITVGAATGFDGVGSAGASLTAGGANGTILFTTVLGAAVRTYSAWVRRKTGTGTVQMTKDGGSTWTTITLTANYPVTPFQVTTASAANPVVGFRLVTSGDAIEVDFNTLEAATFANPTPIPVNVSKAADSLTYASAGNVAQAALSVYFEGSVADVSLAGNFVYLSLTDGTLNNRFQFNKSSGAASVVGALNTTAGGGNGFSITPVSTIVNNTVAKIGMFATTNSANVFVNGVAGTRDSTVDMPTALTTIYVGGLSAVSQELFGTVRNLRLYPVALSSGQLTAMTT